LNTHWKDAEQLVIGAQSPPTVFEQYDHWNTRPDFIEQMMQLDTVTYLPDDILTKVDRASMAVSLEARVPLLDYRVVEFAWSLPLKMKVCDGQTKSPLRQVLRRYVPEDLFERPKVGFGVPINEWLRGPLRDWAEDLLSEERLGRDGFFDPKPIRDKWQKHLDGDQDWHYWLWDVLMFQAWLAHTR
jgi:asparagine synthase (glutamine-hydrolysing)